MTTETLAAEETAASTADLAETLESDVRQYVVFIVGDEAFAVDMTPVQEIIRVPDVVRVPLAPTALDGLANLRGKVLPIMSLRRIFGFPERTYDDSTRAVVIDQGQPLGFVVDRVSSVVGVEPSRIENAGTIRSTLNTELLTGLLKDVAGHAMVMVLDFSKLIADEFKDIAQISRSTGHGGFVAADSDEEEVASDELHLVSFEVAGQEYAILIDDVQEIVQVPTSIIHVPHTESHVLGVMTLRNRLLPLVSLRAMFGLPPRSADEHSRIVVVSLGQAAVGLVMDSVNEVLRVPSGQVDAMPGLLAHDGNLSDITQICRLDSGKRLVSVISAGNMFRHASVKEALNAMENFDEAARQVEAAADNEHEDDEEQMVVFRLDREEFGVPIASVQEIVRVPEALTHVPKAPTFVEGVINLRGAVLPVVDQRRRLGLSTVERNDRQRIMVFLIRGIRTGFIVDSVTEVLKIARTAVEPAPRLSAEQAKLISRVANLPKQKRMVLLIEPANLIEEGDIAQLATMHA